MRHSSTHSIDDVRRERCRRSSSYFASHCQIEDKTAGGWLSFVPWEAQREFLATLDTAPRVVALKARQVGFTWLWLVSALRALTFRGLAVLLFSQTDLEAQELMRRLVEMWRRLPEWLRVPETTDPSKHELCLTNGGQALALATTGRSGRSFTAGMVLIDEADFITDLDALLDSVKPTVDMGGSLCLISTSNKAKPLSPFKQIYRSARKQENGYIPVFHGWRARPGRDDAWYDLQRRDVLARTGSLDRLHQEYPATDAEALSPRTLDKRLPAQWVEECYREMVPLAELPADAPSIPGLVVYLLPIPGRLYVVGADPAEGNPTSCESALCVLDAETGEQCAELGGRIEPAKLAESIASVSRWYSGAPALVERNNHGHAVLLWLQSNSPVVLLCGHDGHIGWLSSAKGKALLYDTCADTMRNRETIIHSFVTATQLMSVEGNTLKPPEGEPSDRAIAYTLANAGTLLALQARSTESQPRVLYTE